MLHVPLHAPAAGGGRPHTSFAQPLHRRAPPARPLRPRPRRLGSDISSGARGAVVPAAMSSLAGLDAKLAALPAQGAFILFKADWCPDCVRSTAAVRQAVAAAGGSLLEVDVADQPAAWKTPLHPLRGDPRFALKGIPTLVAWKGGAAAAKLGPELENASTPAAAGQVAATFIQQHA